jgi:hypothetical protein
MYSSSAEGNSTPCTKSQEKGAKYESSTLGSVSPPHMGN